MSSGGRTDLTNAVYDDLRECVGVDLVLTLRIGKSDVVEVSYEYEKLLRAC